MNTCLCSDTPSIPRAFFRLWKPDMSLWMERFLSFQPQREMEVKRSSKAEWERRNILFLIHFCYSKRHFILLISFINYPSLKGVLSLTVPAPHPGQSWLLSAS